MTCCGPKPRCRNRRREACRSPIPPWPATISPSRITYPPRSSRGSRPLPPARRRLASYSTWTWSGPSTRSSGLIFPSPRSITRSRPIPRTRCCRLLRDLGSCFNLSSRYELDQLLALGVDAEPNAVRQHRQEEEGHRVLLRARGEAVRDGLDQRSQHDLRLRPGFEGLFPAPDRRPGRGQAPVQEIRLPA